MAWQTNLDNLLKDENVFGGAIVNLKTGEVYAKSKEFSLGPHEVTMKDETGKPVPNKVDEIKLLQQLVKDKEVPSNPGMWMNKVNYHITSSFEDETLSIYLKCKSGGAAIVRTAKLILIGTWNDKQSVKEVVNGKEVEKITGQDGGECNIRIEKFAKDFLKSDY